MACLNKSRCKCMPHCTQTAQLPDLFFSQPHTPTCRTRDSGRSVGFPSFSLPVLRKMMFFCVVQITFDMKSERLYQKRKTASNSFTLLSSVQRYDEHAKRQGRLQRLEARGACGNASYLPKNAERRNSPWYEHILVAWCEHAYCVSEECWCWCTCQY